MRKQDGKPGFVQDLARKPPEYKLADTAVSVRTHNKQVTLERERTLDNAVGCRLVLAWNVFGAHGNAVSSEKSSDVFGRAKNVFDLGRSFAR